MKRYRMREQMPAELAGGPENVRAIFPQHSALLQDLLYGRGITSAEDAERFLNPRFDAVQSDNGDEQADGGSDSHDPMLLPDMEKAVERILLAAKTGEKICVWSDYDCDGIPGGVLLSEFLRDVGLSVVHYIPHRHKEGYGLNKVGLKELRERGVTLVITVDLGTTNVDEVAYANELGIDVIITDHHLVAEQLPPAFAVINPKRPDSQYPFDGLCGAGVAWKLVQGVLQKIRMEGNPFDLPAVMTGYAQGREKWLLDLVGIATLSDMVPLVGENRMLARYGLLVMKKNRRPGLAALLSLLRIKPAMLTEDDIGFMIAPRINAASRMDSPQLAASLLAAKNSDDAREFAQALSAVNDERKTVVALTVKEVNKRLATSDLADAPIIVMGNPNWRPGVLGLVANSLMQAHGKPVFLWGREGGEDDVIRGSCRSAGDVSVVEIMQGAADIFAHFGGHTASGGFSLTQERVHELLPRLVASHALLPAVASDEIEILIDRELQLAEVSHAHRELPKLAPFGVGNHKPLFRIPRVTIGVIKIFGKAKDHLEVMLTQDDARATGIAFFSTPESFQKTLVEGALVDIIGHVETDWRGGPRVRVVDVI